MNTNTLLLAIIGHLVGDYLLQNDWQALNKKKAGWVGNMACVIHCNLWTSAVLAFSGWYHADWLFLVCLVLFVTHYIQDRTYFINWWMKINGQNQFATGACAPWSIIVVDNVWHIVTLWAIWIFLI